MSRSLKCLISGWISSVLLCTLSIKGGPQGVLEGYLKIISSRPVQLDDEKAEPTVAAQNYADYPLIVLSRGERKQIARVTADKDGKYRVALPPGDYILDVEGRVRKRLRVTAQTFMLAPNEAVRVDMTIFTGLNAEVLRPQE